MGSFMHKHVFLTRKNWRFILIWFLDCKKRHQRYSLKLDCSEMMSFISWFLHLERLCWCGVAESTDLYTVVFHTLCTSTLIFFVCTAGSAFGAPSDSSLPWEGFVQVLKGGCQERWTSFHRACWWSSSAFCSGQWIAALICLEIWCISCAGSPYFPTVKPEPTQYFYGKWRENIQAEEEQVHGLLCTGAMNL